MNHQSSSVWQDKPWWCKPWSILLTGVGVIFGSWLLFAKVWITGLVAIPSLSWMGFFLVFYPQQVQAYLREIESDQSDQIDSTLDKRG